MWIALEKNSTDILGEKSSEYSSYFTFEDDEVDEKFDRYINLGIFLKICFRLDEEFDMKIKTLHLSTKAELLN